MDSYIGIKYPRVFGLKLVKWLWRHINCRRGMHLLDEVWSPDAHYLSCDACQFSVTIKTVGIPTIKVGHEVDPDRVHELVMELLAYSAPQQRAQNIQNAFDDDYDRERRMNGG